MWFYSKEQPEPPKTSIDQKYRNIYLIYNKIKVISDLFYYIKTDPVLTATSRWAHAQTIAAEGLVK
jgi:hypothetical protein